MLVLRYLLSYFLGLLSLLLAILLIIPPVGVFSLIANLLALQLHVCELTNCIRKRR